jgi:O-antigen ligase
VTLSPIARALESIAFYGLIAVVVLSAAPYGSVEVWWASAAEVAIFALAALWLAASLAAGRPAFARGQEVFAPLAALAIYAWAQSATTSFDPFESRLFALKAGAVAAAGAILARGARAERRLRAVVFAVVVAGLASSAFGIARQTMQHGAQGFVLPRLPAGAGYAQFVNKNHFAFLAETALGLLAGLALGAWSSPRRQRALVYAALGLPVWAALVLSNSRGGVFAMLCEAIFLAATYGAARARSVDVARAARRARFEGDGPFETDPRGRALRLAVRVGLSATLLAALVVGVVWVGGDPLAERIESTRAEMSAGGPETSGASRAEIWRATWAMFEDNPALGVGLGAYWAAVPHYHRASGLMVPQQAHNDYLELAASGGCVACLLLFAFVALLVRRARVSLRSGGDFRRAAAWGALAGLVGVAAHSLVDFGLHVTANVLASAALVAVVSARVEPREDAAGVGRE